MELLSNSQLSQFLDLAALHYGWLIVFISFLTWRWVEQVVARVIPRLQLVVHKRHEWKFKNVFVSLMHSFISGVGASMCLYLDPSIMQKDVNHYQERCYVLAVHSIGYFIHDFFDISRMPATANKKTWDGSVAQAHHVIVILCTACAVASRKYLGPSMVAFLIEVNSIFLHARTLLLVCGVSRRSAVFRVNSFFNFLTFLVNRFLVVAWMTYWLITHRDSVPEFVCFFWSLSIVLLTLINIVLLFQILQSDYMTSKPVLAKPESNGVAFMNGNPNGIVMNGNPPGRVKED